MLLIVLLPVDPLYGVMVAIPILMNSCWIVSAAKVFANPTSPFWGPP